MRDQKQCYATPKKCHCKCMRRRTAKEIVMLKNAGIFATHKPKMCELPGVSCSDVMTSMCTKRRILNNRNIGDITKGICR